MTNKINDPFKSVYAAKTAQSVWNDLKELKKLRPIRWIWELLQNASDASQSVDNSLIAEVKYRQGELIFSHNGRSFTELEVAHLIASGSTKYEDEESIGEFGTGFLTTHLLSLEIEILGQLDNGQKFAFPLRRDMKSREALYESMKQAEKDFKESLKHTEILIPQPFTTQFIYPIKEDAVSAVEKGIETLEQCAPYVVVFNKKFDCININLDTEKERKTLSFQAITSPELDSSAIQQITVTECENGNAKVKEYLLARSKKGTSVAVPLKSDQDQIECLSVGDIPRIFKVFPLVGTESFSCPAIINNSSDFMPTIARDDVPLEENSDGVNDKNRAVIQKACRLLVMLLEHAASKRWYYGHWWAEISATEKLAEQSWLRDRIREEFIEEICQTPVVPTETNKTITPKDAWLPLAENNEGVKELWSLLNDLQEYREKLPRQDEAIGWRKVIQSWAKVNECEVPNLPNVGVIDGRKLASHIENKCSGLEDLQNLLQENICAIDWLNRFYGFLRKDNKIDSVIRGNRLVLNQSGGFNLLKYLHRDQKIGEELKDIAELLGWKLIRHELRDPRLTSLDTEQGADDWDSKYIFEKLHTRIQKQVKPNPDSDFKAASVQLFSWIVAQKDYSRLQNFPMFAADGKSYHSLDSASSNSTTPLAPINAWPKGLKDFKDIFPPDRILADDFFKEVSSSEVWKQLDKQGLVRLDIIIQCVVTDLKLLSPEVSEDKQDHKTAEPIIGVTDFVGRGAIMDRVRNTRERAYLFWRFLTEWLIKADSQYLEVRTAKCNSCEGDISHEHHMAAWLVPVRNNLWIHNDKDTQRFNPNAQSLANLLRDNGWELNSLDENPDAVKLLEAIGVPPSDLKLEFIAEDKEKRDGVINIATTLYDVNPNDLSQVNELVQHASDGNLSQINAVAQDLKEDEDLYEDLEKRRKRRDIVHKNQRLGKQVEELVEENLIRAGFKVKVTGIGSDFQILPDWEDTEDITTLEITNSNDQSWLIEVKSTRYQSVHMSSKQAETAAKAKEKFLLCVVPLEQEEVTPEIVRQNMRFIQNIGSSVTPLWQDLNSLEELREEITTDASGGIKLVCKAGIAGVCVNKSVWENDGFPLEKLAEHLK